MSHKLYRDDDVNVYTCPFAFKALHEEFIKRKEVHTVAVIMKDLWENHALFYYLATAPYLEIGLHGWEHWDYSEYSYENCYIELNKALEYWEENAKRMVGYAKPIDTFFAPWNHESEYIKLACKELGLKFCATKKGEWDGKYINSFHHWYLELNPQDIPKLFK
ncbi:MAG: hypothetical protein AAB875_07330 [Patescibacteria group bacterium]